MKLPAGHEVAGPGRKLLRSRQELPGRRQAGSDFRSQEKFLPEAGGFCLRQEAGRSWISGRILAPAQAGGRQELNVFQNFEAVGFCLRQLISAWGPGRKFLPGAQAGSLVEDFQTLSPSASSLCA